MYIVFILKVLTLRNKGGSRRPEKEGDKEVLKDLAGGWALCPQGDKVVCPKWWNGVPLACCMLGLSSYNYKTENLAANHSGASCWERCHVPRTLKTPAVVFDCPTLPIPPIFLWQSKFLDPWVPSHFSFHHHQFMFIISSISCSSSEYS